MRDLIQLAPIRGFTDVIYRNTFDEYFKGIDTMVAPFISSVKGSRIKKRLLRDVLPENNGRTSLIPQILGKSAEEFVTLSRALFEVGYKTVNWNLGCPSPSVANKGRGSGLLPYPDRIDAFLDKVLNNIPNQLSLKVRLGRFEKKEIFDLIPIFNRYPLVEIIIHPRTGVQMYNGEVDLETFRRCVSISGHPVVYNGDIVSFESFLKIKQKISNVYAWMIGRGVLANPFLPEIIKAGHTNISFPLQLFKAFHDTLLRRYSEKLRGPSYLLQRMKGLWKYLVRCLDRGDTLLKQIQKAENMTSYERAVNAYFEQGGGLKKNENLSTKKTII
jgi:tRNA-dihydrouridine synthase